jgi:hypothetical protein
MAVFAWVRKNDLLRFGDKSISKLNCPPFVKVPLFRAAYIVMSLSASQTYGKANFPNREARPTTIGSLGLRLHRSTILVVLI